METRTSADILSRLTLSMLLPFILVAIGILLAAFFFYLFGVNIVALALILAIPIGIAVLVNYPRFLPVFLFSVLIPIQIPVTRALRMTLDEIIVPILFFIYVLQRTVHRSDYNRVSFHNIPKGIIFLLIIGVIWFIVSGDVLPQNIFGFEEAGSFRAYFTFFVGIMGYFILMSLIKDEKHIHQILKTLYWLSILSIFYLLSLVALNQVNTPILPGVSWSIGYISGSRFSIRSIAMSTAALMLFLVALTGEYPKSMKYRIPSLLLALMTIMYSGGRGTFGGWILAILVYLYLKRKYLILAGMAFMAMAAVGIPALFPRTVEQLPESFRRVFEYRMDPAEKSSGARSWQDRLELWKASLQEIKKRPLTGAGFRGFDINLAINRQVTSQEFFVETGVTSGSTHNAYLAYAQIFGLPALILFLAIYLNHMRRAWKMYRKHPDPHVHGISLFFVLNFVAYLVINMGGGGPKDVAFLMYLGMTQAIWILVVNNQKVVEEEPEKPVAQQPAFAAAIRG